LYRVKCKIFLNLTFDNFLKWK